MDSNHTRAFFVVACFSLIFIILFGSIYGGQVGGDYERHFYKASIGCDDGVVLVGWTQKACETYAPLFHWLAKPFSFHRNAFFYFSLTLLAIITPLALYFWAKDWLVVVLYFSTTSYFFFHIDGFFPQALATLLVILVWWKKDWHIQLPLLLLSTFTHGSGFILVLLAIVLSHLNDLAKPFFLGCSGTFGTNTPAVLKQKIIGFSTTGDPLELGHILIFFFKIFPAPFWLASIWQSVKEKEWGLIIFSFILLALGLTVSHRIFYVIPIVFIPALARFYRSLSGWPRIAFGVLFFLSFVYQVYSFWNFKTCLGGI